MKRSLSLAVALALLGSCRSAPADPWSPGFTPPGRLDTPRVHLEPLGPQHAAIDHAAFSSSSEYLRRTLHWGDWPRAGMTVEQNAIDLQRHWTEFALRQAYAYTVLTPDRARCLGCIYLNQESIRYGGDPSVLLAYWVVQSELASNLDHHLVASVLDWIRRDWPFATVFIAPHLDDARAPALAAELHMQPIDVAGEGIADRRIFAWGTGR